MRALLIIDVQNGAVEEETTPAQADQLIARINQLLGHFRQEGRVVFVRHTAAEDGLPRGSLRWQLDARLASQPSDVIVDKETSDAFLHTILGEILDGWGIREVVVVGLSTDYCVDASVRGATARGYRVTVISDAHACGVRPELTSAQVKAHHERLWQGLTLPAGRRICVVATDAYLARN